MRFTQQWKWYALTILALFSNVQVSHAQTMSTREDSVQALTKILQDGKDNPKDSTSGRAVHIYFMESQRSNLEIQFSEEIHAIVLTKMLADPYACVRATAAERLGLLRPMSSSIMHSSIKALHALISDGSPSVRLKAVGALINLGASDSAADRIILDIAKGKDIDNWSTKGFFPSSYSSVDKIDKQTKIIRTSWQNNAIAYLRHVGPESANEAKEIVTRLQTSPDPKISSHAKMECREFWEVKSSSRNTTEGVPK